MRVRDGGTKQALKELCGFRTAEVVAAHETRGYLAKLDIADFADHALPIHTVFIWLAIASAFIIAPALLTVSSYSRCGSESATIPAPA